jgi:hypothetical protein
MAKQIHFRTEQALWLIYFLVQDRIVSDLGDLTIEAISYYKNSLIHMVEYQKLSAFLHVLKLACVKHKELSRLWKSAYFTINMPQSQLQHQAK